MEENDSKHSGIKKDTVLFLMVIYALFLPLYEIVVLISVVATVIDPTYPVFNTVISLMVPAVVALIFSFVTTIPTKDRNDRKPLYLMGVIAIITFAIIGIDSYQPIAGYVDDANLWTLIMANIVVYFFAMLWAIAVVYMKKKIK